MTVAGDERHQLCDLFEDVGPRGPTLLEGWSTTELLAHLLVRERRPDAAIGILVERFAPRTERTMATMIRTTSYAEMVRTLRSGPPLWSPYALPLLGDRANLFEFYVHHEDVRRAAVDWQPRPSDTLREEALWKLLRLSGRLLYRRSPVGVGLRSAGREDVIVHKGARTVFVVGLPGEITLHAFGRAADRMHVVLQGDPDDVAALSGAPRGM